MALSFYNLKKWWLMISGKSVWHVNQDMGKNFLPDKLAGYYNNLTEKVTMKPELMESDELPILITEDGSSVYFPVAIFQYGLGAYDLFLQTKDGKYFEKFMQCARWALNFQENTGAWNNFFHEYPESPYGAMCQGEGASLLLRAYKETGDEDYLNAALIALDFMLLPVEKGGASQYIGDDLILLEFTHLPAVLNGWVFALFGLHDAVVSGHGEKYREALNRTIKTLSSYLPLFDNGYWSLYDLDGKLTSPFYHDLHIAQMQAMYLISKCEVFNETATRWSNYGKSKTKKAKAFIKKVWQKIRE